MLLPDPGQVHWLYLDMNSYFASVEQQLRPELRGRPVAVTPVLAETACCIAASRQAKDLGVVTGMDVRQARKLCPELIVVEARQERYAEFHHRVLAAVSACIPVEHVLSIDEFACRLAPAQRIPPRALALANAIKQNIAQSAGEWLRCSVGIGPNLLLSKIAAERQKPDGCVVLTRLQLPEVLMQLAIAEIPGIGPRMETRLAVLGIRSMVQLWQLSPGQLRTAWGSVLGERLWHKLRGLDFDEPAGPPRSIGHQHVLPPALRTMPLAGAVGRRLLARAAARLRARGLAARGLSVYLSFTPGREKRMLECHAKLPGTDDTVSLAELFNRMWSDVPHGRPTLVGVELYHLLPAEQQSIPLFPEMDKGSRISAAMDSITARYGPESLSWAAAPEVRKAAPRQIAFSSIPNF